MGSSDLAAIMAGLAPGQYVYLDAESLEDNTRIARLVTQLRHVERKKSENKRFPDDARFSTKQGVAVFAGRPQYIIKITRDA